MPHPTQAVLYGDFIESAPKYVADTLARRGRSIGTHVVCNAVETWKEAGEPALAMVILSALLDQIRT